MVFELKFWLYFLLHRPGHFAFYMIPINMYTIMISQSRTTTKKNVLMKPEY